jgi:hypothetical protein
MMAISQFYADSLLPLKHGYPLYWPEIEHGESEVYRQIGVSVGDVGIITGDGGFDLLFNICKSSSSPDNNNPVNTRGVPEGLQLIDPGRLRIRPNWISTQYPHLANGSSVV